MKNFDHFGVKQRRILSCNYTAIWKNLVTIRLGREEIKELPPDKAEFYDVSLGSYCNLGTHIDGKYLPPCPWCYVNASCNGEHYENVCETWVKFMSTFSRNVARTGVISTLAPFQIAIGSEGEPLTSPYFCDFLETVYNTGVVPNYTTNGVILASWDKPESEYYELSRKILTYTQKYVGGVAISVGNKALHSYAFNAIKGLIELGDTNINIHHIISDKNSVQDFIDIWNEYGDLIAYHVLLPLMPSGRSTKGIEDGTFELLEKTIQDLNITNIAFGAHFIDHIRKSSIKAYTYEPESLSKNILLKKDKVIITPSSFNLNPVKVIEF